jgi:hypothetical protein
VAVYHGKIDLFGRFRLNDGEPSVVHIIYFCANTYINYSFNDYKLSGIFSLEDHIGQIKFNW